MKSKLKDIVANAYDLHVHIGPEIIPRKYTARTLLSSEKGKLKGAVLKNHFYPTVPMIEPNKDDGLALFGCVVLNNSVGGMNAEVVYAMSLISENTFFVWMPTINAEQFLRCNKYEIAPEWVADKSIKLKSAEKTSPVKVSRNGGLTPDTILTINMVAEVGAVLATGHIGSDESVLAAEYARGLGVQVVITHPIYQHINMPIETQKRLAKAGCYLEQSYSMFSMDGIAIEKIAEQIKNVGADSVILSSDVGQEFSPSPSEALLDFAKKLMEVGITIEEIEKMLVENPKKILKIN